MAFSIPGLMITLKSSGDMSSYQYALVSASTTNVDGGCVLASARGQQVTGVWLNNSTAAEYGPVQVTGVAPILAGDSSAMENAITQGAVVRCSSVGRAVPSTASIDGAVGLALESLGTGSTGVISILLNIGTTSTG